ncbi:FkbM family methyltransferase [Polynucleobacter paneuropaeus]|nr:FkbM family methyltransferase [Polynucleobacter paneuropaeus]
MSLAIKRTTVPIKLNESKILFSFRKDSIGDKGVIQQIFQNQDYNIASWEQGKKLLQYHCEQSKIRPSLIIDAGANIGASTVYFSIIFPNSFIFSIEPDTENWQLLEMNTAGLDRFNFNGAIADIDGELIFEDPGRSDWGFMTKPVSASDTAKNIKKVKSISPASILAHSASQNTNPLIIKIDIEGGEEALFNGDTSWLSKFPLVIIELHDWMLPFSGSSRNFIKAIAQYDFDFMYRGENIFLFNRQILNA